MKNRFGMRIATYSYSKCLGISKKQSHTELKSVGCVSVCARKVFKSIFKSVHTDIDTIR